MIDRTVAKDGIGWLLIGAAVLLVGVVGSAADTGWGPVALGIGVALVVLALAVLAYELLRSD